MGNTWGRGGVDYGWNMQTTVKGAAPTCLLLVVATLALKGSLFFKKKRNFQIFKFEVSLI